MVFGELAAPVLQIMSSVISDSSVEFEMGYRLRTVIKIPGETELTLIRGPEMLARHLTRKICAALVTA